MRHMEIVSNQVNRDNQNSMDSVKRYNEEALQNLISQFKETNNNLLEFFIPARLNDLEKKIKQDFSEKYDTIDFELRRLIEHKLTKTADKLHQKFQATIEKKIVDVEERIMDRTDVKGKVHWRLNDTDARRANKFRNVGDFIFNLDRKLSQIKDAA